MPARLRQHPVARIHQEDGQGGRGSGGREVARVLLVARGIGDDELALGGGKIPVSDIDGDALFPFRPQAIRQQREIERAGRLIYRRLARRRDLVLIDALRIVEQPPDQRGLAVIHAARGREPQQLLLLVLPQKRVDAARFEDPSAQKYPSRLFISMNPSRSWSITRFSRPDPRNSIISSMIFRTVSASEPISPLHGLQP